MTKEQIKLIHIASSNAGLSRAQYESILLNVGGVKSSKDLTNQSFEDCMAVMEDEGFPGTYWRQKVRDRGSRANSRLVWKIKELYAQFEARQNLGDTHYELAGLVARASGNTARDPNALRPFQAINLIELLKSLISRTTPPVAANEVPE